METGTQAAILVGYALFVPLIWQIGNALIRTCIIRPLGTGALVRNARPVGGKEAVTDEKSGSSPQEGTAQEREARELKAGRVIGALERLLIVAGLCLGKWEVLVAVITLKTVARFPELEKQIRAEYFLIGSLASVLWALLCAVALLIYDQGPGYGVFPASLLGAVRPGLS